MSTSSTWTGGGTVLRRFARGSTTATPRAVATHRRPSCARIAEGNAALHSAEGMPSVVP
jgi:hypothetical protein